MKLQSDRFNFGDMYPQYWTPSIGGTYHWSELVIFFWPKSQKHTKIVPIGYLGLRL